MTPFLSRSLRDEVAVITPDDDRKPLARARPTPAPMLSESELERRVLRELTRMGGLEEGQIGARLLIREGDVSRALLKLALASRVVRCKGYHGVAMWKACGLASEESV